MAHCTFRSLAMAVAVVLISSKKAGTSDNASVIVDVNPGAFRPNDLKGERRRFRPAANFSGGVVKVVKPERAASIRSRRAVTGPVSSPSCEILMNFHPQKVSPPVKSTGKRKKKTIIQKYLVRDRACNAHPGKSILHLIVVSYGRDRENDKGSTIKNHNALKRFHP
jgi:hypothetical protein